MIKSKYLNTVTTHPAICFVVCVVLRGFLPPSVLYASVRSFWAPRMSSKLRAVTVSRPEEVLERGEQLL